MAFPPNPAWHFILNPVQALADDVLIEWREENVSANMLSHSVSAMVWTWGQQQCAVFCERRSSGNRWQGAKYDQTPSFPISGGVIRVYARHEDMNLM